MTILAEPATIGATASRPAEPAAAAGDPRRRCTSVEPAALSGHRSAAAIDDNGRPVAAGLLPRVHDEPPMSDGDRVGVRTPAASGGTVPQCAVDTWPLRKADPAWVAGYRLVSRLGAGGMADVFYALAPSGRPVAVKILRAVDGAPRTCHREYRLASAVDADCTAPALGHGLSPAGPYLVTAYLPGYRSATTLVGRPPGMWASGARTTGWCGAAVAGPHPNS
jgi:hypothetical protein